MEALLAINSHYCDGAYVFILQVNSFVFTLVEPVRLFLRFESSFLLINSLILTKGVETVETVCGNESPWM